MKCNTDLVRLKECSNECEGVGSVDDHVETSDWFEHLFDFW